jgi:hypothetical protein
MNIQIPAQGWIPRDYQLAFTKYMCQNKKGLRAVVAWHRRAGKDLTSINIMAVKALQRKGLYLYIGPFNNQIRRIIWQGQDGDGRKFIDFIPRELVSRKSEQEMSLTLTNGSVVQLLGADNPDKLVGINPVGIVFSEYSLCDKQAWTLTNPILAENGGWALFNGTPRGQNHFYDILLRAQADKNWFASHLGALDTKAISPEDLRRARKEQDNEAKFQSEFMCSFHTPIEGAYYGSIMSRLYAKDQIVANIPVEPSLPVHTAWDLGMDDSTSIWFFQMFGKEVRIVHYLENSGEGLPYYARELDRWAILNDASYGKHYAPHDIAVREMGTGRSRLETARKLGIRFTKVKRMSVQDGIEAVRVILPQCWFSEDKCHMGIEHMKSYHKDFDSAKNVFKKSPVHDAASHGADAFRTLACGLKQGKGDTTKERGERSQYKEVDVSL